MPKPPAPEKTPETKPDLTEAAPEPKKADNSNPFANLSLDASWDPNSAEKPKIEEKQRAPKSQALIDAEERAKKLQTKE
jgi:hypothetical protein